MSRLSIFSSDVLHVSARKLLPTFCCTLALFFAADKVIERFDPIRLYGGWESPHVQEKIDGARQMKKRFGRIDLMLLGSSIGVHIDVGKWQEAFGDQVICYDAAMIGQHPHWERFIFENEIYPQTKPSQVIYVVSPRDVNRPSVSDPLTRNDILFQSHNARKYLANTAIDRLNTLLESASYLFEGRRHVRTWIQKGPVTETVHAPLFENGVHMPTVRHQSNTTVTEAERKALQHNPYARFQMPDDGELGELLKLAEFCKKHNVGFRVVNQCISPRAAGFFDNYKRDYQLYLAGLEKIRKAGVEVIDMPRELKISNSDFSDSDHANRWGNARMTNYIYTRVVRPLYPQKALVGSLPEEMEVHLCDLLSRTNDAFFPQDCSRRLQRINYASAMQVVTDAAGGKLELKTPLPAGSYILDLYAADERLSPTLSQAPCHKMAYQITGSDGKLSEVPFELSRKNVLGETLTRLPLTLQTTSTLAIVVKELSGKECILDSLFIRPKASRQVAQIASLAKEAAVGDPMLVRNGSFEHLDGDRQGCAAEWLPYNEAWGHMELVSEDTHSGKRALKMSFDPKSKVGWGCLAIQSIAPVNLERLRGKQVTISAWVKCSGPKVVGFLRVTRQKSQNLNFTPYSQVGQWQKIELKTRIDADARWLVIGFGALGDAPALVDDVTLEETGA